jgi:hypothetical protein
MEKSMSVTARIPILSSLTLLAMLTSACMPKVGLTVLEPAEIGLPSDVRTLAVIDRSAPKNAGQHLLGALEGAATGEGLGTDRAGASEAVNALVDALAASPRFDVVVPIETKRGVDSNLFDKVLDWRTARRIANRVGADAIVSLEAFDSDSIIHVDVDRETVVRNGREVEVKEFEAQRETDVLAAWRVYDVKRKVLLDDRRDVKWSESWAEEGDTRVEAVQALPSPEATVITVGRVAGLDYGERIAPHYSVIQRPYYGAGDERLKTARNYVKMDDWENAAALWKAIVKEGSDTKLVAKASHNLALYHELHGRLDRARKSAKQAVALGGGPASRTYVRDLEMRIADAHVLNAQMAAR